MRKKLYFIVIITSIFFIMATIIIINFEKNTNKIEKKLQGVRISKESLDVIENVTIDINGSVDENNEGFIFTGKLHLNNLDFSDGNHSTLIYQKSYEEDNMIERGLISYPRNIIINSAIYPDFATVQLVYTDSNLSYLILANYDDDCINNPSEGSIKVYQENDILVFPATDAKSALALIKDLQIDQDIFHITNKSPNNIPNKLGGIP